MLVILSIVFALFGALTAPYVDRLDATSIWLARIMTTEFGSEDIKKSLVLKLRLGLRTSDSFLFNTFETFAPLSIFIGSIIGFFYTWWFGILIFFMGIWLSKAALW